MKLSCNIDTKPGGFEHYKKCELTTHAQFGAARATLNLLTLQNYLPEA